MKPKTASGPELWNKAKKIIPGGNQLLSKRAEMFLPDHWPAYYEKAKGVEVWDLEGRHLIDMSIMGIGTCILGYANDQVNEAVKKAVNKGTMCTLNCPEEVELAETLISLHPWAQQVRFARSGGEACSIAVRIARAATGKDKIAFCGYHGWTDWYLSANIADTKHLDGQLLPGLSPTGVPRALKDTALPFQYGDIESFKKIFEQNKGQIAAVVMEVQRHKPIDLSFINEVQKIARQNNALIIFDEVTSGFRLREGGLHTLYDLKPDMVVLGKAMGNGYPIAAIVGTSAAMDAAQGTFISSTYWTERIGYVAALETIRVFKQEKVGNHLKETGEFLMDGLRAIFKEHSLNIEVTGIHAVPIISIKESNPLVIKTFFTQEMLKRGYLAGTVIYLSLAHTREVIRLYLEEAAKVFKEIRAEINRGGLEKRLEGPVCHSGFARLS